MEYVLKIGGSVLTDKSSENTLSNNFSETLAKIEPGGVLVHGAGSFGHPQAERQGLKENIQDGYLEPHNAVKQLNRKVVSELEANGLKPVPIHSSSIAYREDGKTHLQLETVKKAVERGFTPVLHGDMILENGGFSVISGDELVALIEKKVNTGNAGFCTSEKGVLGKDGEPIAEVNSIKQLHDKENGQADVTGGMKGKVQTVLESGIDARIFGPKQLEDFFQKREPGTIVKNSDL